jgi:hypothetical protein
MGLSGIAANGAKTVLTKTTAAGESGVAKEAADQATTGLSKDVFSSGQSSLANKAGAAATDLAESNSPAAKGFWDVFNKVFNSLANDVSEREYGHKF